MAGECGTKQTNSQWETNAVANRQARCVPNARSNKPREINGNARSVMREGSNNPRKPKDAAQLIDMLAVWSLGLLVRARHEASVG